LIIDSAPGLALFSVIVWSLSRTYRGEGDAMAPRLLPQNTAQQCRRTRTTRATSSSLTTPPRRGYFAAYRASLCYRCLDKKDSSCLACLLSGACLVCCQPCQQTEGKKLNGSTRRPNGRSPRHSFAPSRLAHTSRAGGGNERCGGGSGGGSGGVAETSEAMHGPGKATTHGPAAEALLAEAESVADGPPNGKRPKPAKWGEHDQGPTGELEGACSNSGKGAVVVRGTENPALVHLGHWP